MTVFGQQLFLLCRFSEKHLLSSNADSFDSTGHNLKHLKCYKSINKRFSPGGSLEVAVLIFQTDLHCIAESFIEIEHEIL